MNPSADDGGHARTHTPTHLSRHVHAWGMHRRHAAESRPQLGEAERLLGREHVGMSALASASCADALGCRVREFFTTVIGCHASARLPVRNTPPRGRAASCALACLLLTGVTPDDSPVLIPNMDRTCVQDLTLGSARGRQAQLRSGFHVLICDSHMRKKHAYRGHSRGCSVARP